MKQHEVTSKAHGIRAVVNEAPRNKLWDIKAELRRSQPDELS